MKKLYFLFVCVLSILTAQAQIAPKAVNDAANVAEGGSVTLNVLANDSNFNAGDSACVTALWGAPSGWVTTLNCGHLLFHPLNPTYVGRDTFYYRACDVQFAGLCDTGTVIVNVYILAPQAISDTVTVAVTDSAIINVLANDANFNAPDTIKVTAIWGAPAGWAHIQDSTQVIFRSLDSNYSGLVVFRYRACDMNLPNLCDTGIIAVNVIKTPKALKDTVLLFEPDTAFVRVLANDSDFNVLDSVCITALWGMNAAWASYSCNQVIFHPADFNYTGSDTLYYRSCYTRLPAVCDTGMLVVAVILPRPYVDFTYTEFPACEAQITSNSILADSLVWTVQFLTQNGRNDTIYDSLQIAVAANMDSDFQAQVCLTGYNGSGDSTICYTFWIQCGGNTGVADLSAERLLIYPNPAADKIQIVLPKWTQSSFDAPATLAIYDIVGKELKEIAMSDINAVISVNELNPGVYMLGIKNKNQDRKILAKFEIVR